MRKERGLVATLFAWNDLLLTLFAAAIFLFAVLITQIQKTKSDEAKQDNAMTGNIAVYCFWADGLDTDVDLHLMGPDGDHIFYRKMQGRFWSILRDDLGITNDPAPRNFENAATRGLEPGPYVINVHAYRGNETSYPVTVDCEVRVNPRANASNSTPQVFRTTVVLSETGDEQTILTFEADPDGQVIGSSVSRLFQSIIRR